MPQNEMPHDEAAAAQQHDADSEQQVAQRDDSDAGPIAAPGSRGYFKRGDVARRKGPKVRMTVPTIR